MFRVDDIWDEGMKIVGSCDSARFLRWVGDAVSLIVNKADFEGLKGFLDICTSGCASCNSSATNSCNSRSCGRRCITLPREVDNILAVNIGGRPALGFSQLFNFHLNGPGDCRTGCQWSWMDQGGFHSTIQDLLVPAQLVAHLQSDADNGKELIVYGFDTAGQKLTRTDASGNALDGYQVPTIYGVATPDSQAPTISRITGIFKATTSGSVRLATTDAITLGIYEPDEHVPQYRRIQINRSCSWVRIAYMKASPTFTSRYDHIPLKSRIAVLLAMQARKHYANQMWPEAHAAEADAARLEIEAQFKSEPPLSFPIQVHDRSESLRDKTDYDIV